MRRLLLVMGLLVAPALGQGCSQCREAVGQAPQRTQTAYRQAIGLMVFAGVSVFSGALLVMRRFR